MRYVYVDESGSLGPGETSTWVLARYADPFEAAQFVAAEWHKGATLLRDLRRLFATVQSVAATTSPSAGSAHDEVRSMRRVMGAIAVNPAAECHATVVVRLTNLLHAWSDPSDPSTTPPQFVDHSTIGMALAAQPTIAGTTLATLARCITTGEPAPGRNAQVATLVALRDKIIEANGRPSDTSEQFDLLLRCIGHGVLDAFRRVVDVGLRSADRTVVLRIHGDAGIAPNRQYVATEAITSACRHLLGNRSGRRQATVLIDGEFRDGMKMTEDLTCVDGFRLVTGVVPVNSLGTPLIWVSDAAANILNRPLGTDPVRERLRSDILRRVRPNDMIEIRTVDDWVAFTRTSRSGREPAVPLERRAPTVSEA